MSRRPEIALRSDPPDAPVGSLLRLQQTLAYTLSSNGIRPKTAKGTLVELAMLHGAAAAGLETANIAVLSITGNSLLELDLSGRGVNDELLPKLRRENAALLDFVRGLAAGGPASAEAAATVLRILGLPVTAAEGEPQ